MWKYHLMSLAMAGALAGFADTTAQTPTPPGGARPDLMKSPLEGSYVVIAGEKNGQPIPEDHFKGSLVRITGDMMTGTDKDRKEFFASSYVLSSDKEPWSVRMKSTVPKDGVEAFGLVKRDKDTLTIIYSLPGGEKPTEFKTKDRQHMFVLKVQNAG